MVLCLKKALSLQHNCDLLDGTAQPQASPQEPGTSARSSLCVSGPSLFLLHLPTPCQNNFILAKSCQKPSRCTDRDKKYLRKKKKPTQQ